MRYSIITVTYNAETCIRKTIESVLHQNYNQYEYIVKDGTSTDGTIQIIKQYAIEFMKKGISFKYISTKDSGIFDAMNEAVQYCDGTDYVLFLNAGDFLVDDNVIKNVDKIASQNESEIIYGNYYLYSENYRKHIVSAKYTELPYRMMCTHQAIFTKLNLLKKRPYNTEYQMVSDYDFYLEMYLNKISFTHIDVDIIYFDIQGISQNKSAVTQHERFEMLYRKQCISPLKYHMRWFIIIRIYLQKLILRKIPKRVRFRNYEYINKTID